MSMRAVNNFANQILTDSGGLFTIFMCNFSVCSDEILSNLEIRSFTVHSFYMQCLYVLESNFTVTFVCEICSKILFALFNINNSKINSNVDVFCIKKKNAVKTVCFVI